MCRNLIELAQKNELDCPIRITPSCHPRAHCEVYAKAKTWEIIICCSKCDRQLAKINVRARGWWKRLAASKNRP